MAIEKQLYDRRLINTESLHVLDLGCGTGLLSFMLLPYVDTLVGVDASTGMTDALNAKIAQRKSFGDSNATKLAAVCTLLEDPADPKLQAVIAELRKSEVEGQLLRFDLVVSHLMLHHIPSLKDILATMLRCLDEGGMVALTDFEDFGEDAILFHPESKRDGVERHGIKKEEMEKLMIDAGFVDVRIERPFELKKQVELEHGKAEMAFPFLLCLGRKP